jgi:hypothetical protein
MRDLYSVLNVFGCANSKDIKVPYWALAATPRPNKPQESEREPRLVSSGATALRWLSTDEPFVNLGRRKRLEPPEGYKAQKLMLGISE